MGRSARRRAARNPVCKLRPTLAAEVLEVRSLLTTFTVLNTLDTGEGTLRDAINLANENPGADEIDFAIGSGGVATIALSSPLPAITDSVDIDGTTQPGYAGTPLIQLDGSAAGTGDGLVLLSGGNTVKGLAIGLFAGYGIRDAGIGGNTIAANTIGTTKDGIAAWGNLSGGVFLTSSGNTVGGGIAAGLGNVISGNSGHGITLSDDGATGNLIVGNRIGTSPAGNVGLGNSGSGVYLLNGAFGNTIGGTSPDLANTISGNAGNGVDILFSSQSNVIVGNRIGTDVGGTLPLGNAGNGVSIFTADNNQVGQTGAGNVIQFNNGAGVSVVSGTGNALLDNAIDSNTGLGIDLGADGVTPNDPGDADSGPNNLQNAPTLVRVSVLRTATIISGMLSSTPNSSFLIQIFYSPAADPSGSGEGAVLAGSFTVNTDSTGVVTFTKGVSVAIPVGSAVSATATDAQGNTSEFSADITASKPTLSINNVSVVEGDSGTTNAGFTVTLSDPDIEEAVSVDYATADGSAVQGQDYVPTSGTLTFNPGETTKTIVIQVVGDTLDESDETFSVVLSSPANALIASGTGTGTILDDDPAPTIAIADASRAEGDSGQSDMLFTVTLSAPSGQSVTVSYQTSDGTALAGTDYLSRSGSLTFLPGETTKMIAVPILGDTLTEPNKTFLVTLSSPVNASIADATAVGTILDDDAIPSASINSLSYLEGTNGTPDFAFTVTLSSPSSKTVQLSYATVDGSATAGADYIAQSGVLTFAPGETTKTIHISVIGDSLVEPTESFSVVLTSPVNATIANATGTGTILNDDTGGTFQILEGSYQVTESPTAGQSNPLKLIVSRLGGQASEVAVDLYFGAGNATPGLDYVATPYHLVFGAGEAFKEVTVPILGDLLIEGDEIFGAALFGPTSGASLGSVSRSVITIHDASSTVVTNTNDDGAGSLRQAIQTADVTPGPNTVSFAIPALGTQIITPLSPLPDLIDPYTTIDGTTQPTYAGVPVIVLDGRLLPAAAPASLDALSGLTIRSGHNTIRSLSIVNFPGHGIAIVGPGQNAILSSKLGVYPTNEAALGNGLSGVSIVDSPYNLIGGPSPGEGNVISANRLDGVDIAGASSIGNALLGNRIGTDVTGERAIGNTFDGVFIKDGSQNQVGPGNLISGNGAVGVQISGASASANVVQGNLIGLDLLGSSPLPNGQGGLFIEGSSGNFIGNGNVISGNASTGVTISGPGASNNTFVGNVIGLDATGTRAIGNLFDGIYIVQASGNRIGVVGALRNVISGNGGVGIQILGQQSTGNFVQNNFIGTDATGLVGRGNKTDGVFLNGAPSNTIGGPGAGAGNVVSGNGSVGIQDFGGEATGNVIVGNIVGLDARGVSTISNEFGVFLNRVGDPTLTQVGASNLVRGNRTRDLFFDNGSAGPRVSNAREQTSGGNVTGVILSFDAPMDVNRVSNPANYSVTSAGPDRRFGTGDDAPLLLSAVSFDPIQRAATLTFSQPVPTNTVLRVVARSGGATGITDAVGIPLDGNGDFQAGGNYQVVLGSAVGLSKANVAVRDVQVGQAIASRRVAAMRSLRSRS